MRTAVRVYLAWRLLRVLGLAAITATLVWLHLGRVNSGPARRSALTRVGVAVRHDLSSTLEQAFTPEPAPQ